MIAGATPLPRPTDTLTTPAPTSTPAAASTPTAIPPPAGMVAWWSGDGNSEDTIGGRHVAVVVDATFARGMVGEAFSLDGAGDYIQLPGASEVGLMNSDFTGHRLSALLKQTAS